jgi:hypothetical protein
MSMILWFTVAMLAGGVLMLFWYLGSALGPSWVSLIATLVWTVSVVIYVLKILRAETANTSEYEISEF